MRHYCPALHLGEGSYTAPLLPQGGKVSQIHMHARKKTRNSQTNQNQGRRTHMRGEKENERVQTRPGKIKKIKKCRDSNSRNGGGLLFRAHFLSPGTPLVGSFGAVSSSAWLLPAPSVEGSLNPEFCPEFLDRTLFHSKGRNLNSDNSRNQYIC